MKKIIKLFDPMFDQKEQSAIQNVLKSKFWASGSGSGKVLEFENKFKKYTGTKECIAVNSGTAALHLALSVLDIKNKEVILPSLSFVSTANAVLYNGGKPVFVDVDPKTLCIDPEQIRKKITKKTSAVMPVHFGGFPANLKEINSICSKNNLHLIEDAAHASGSSYQNKKIGSNGEFVCFSFHPVKNLAMPTGGAITINSKFHKKFTDVLKAARWCGITKRHGFNYDVKEIGWNYYMNEFSAAIGIAQLKKLNLMNSIRTKIAKVFSNELSVESKIPFSKDCAYHLFWIQVKNRNLFIKNMKDNNIEVGIHYKPIHKMSLYNSKVKLPITEKISKNIVSLPIHPNLTEYDVDKIVTFTNRFYNL